MKAYVILFVFCGLSINIIKAQNISEKFNDIKGFVLPDSLVQEIKKTYDISIAIPNVYIAQPYHYTMPIKKLSGRGLAPMPGTEHLDRFENLKLALRKRKENTIRK